MYPIVGAEDLESGDLPIFIGLGDGPAVGLADFPLLLAVSPWCARVTTVSPVGLHIVTKRSPTQAGAHLLT